jgi:gliding motility-associated-like protein
LKTKYLTLFFLLWITSVDAGASPRMKRICASQNGVNTLFWFPYNDVCTNGLKIIVHGRKDKLSNWEKIDSLSDISATTYEHKNAIGYLRGSYFVEFVYNCGKVVSHFSDTVEVDVFSPDMMEPDSVSVGADGEVYIGWKPQKATDTKSYIVYRTVNNNNFPIDTIYGRGSTFFVDTSHGKPWLGPEKYKLAPVDSCDNIAPIGALHQTIFLKVSSDSCRRQFYLSWSAYIGWVGVSAYEVWASRNDDAHYVLLGRTTDLNFTFNSAITNSTYKFFIKGINKYDPAITSSSNRVSRFANFGVPLKYLYIGQVTNDGQGHIRLSWINSNRADIAYFKIYRSALNSQSLSLYTTVPAAGLGIDSFTDVNTDPDNVAYYYQVRAFNFCENPIGVSNISNSIVLRRDSVPNISNLSWNGYRTWLGGVDIYEVQRSTGLPDEHTWEVIATTTDTFYSDKDSFGEYSRLGICYRILAMEGENDSLGFLGRSFSNTQCRIDAPRVWMPNVFTTNALSDVNKVFRPIVLHVDTLQGSLMIYNRWGERIFSADNLSSGWDGTYKGRKAPSGVYLYLVEAVGYDGTRKYLKGNVMLLE